MSRPGYGLDPLATSKLPGGGPSDRGAPLRDDIPGTQTFTKPLDDHGTDDSAEEGSIYRVDGPRDIGKRQDNGGDGIDHSEATPSYYGLGERDPNDYSKTKYPYRDDKSNTHNAADADFVAQLYVLAKKAGIVFTYRERASARIAATAEQILGGLNPKFVERSKKVSVTLKRADIKRLRWIFSVKGTGTYAVKMRAIRPKKNRTKLSKMDLELSCSCPAWQWLGPEYHATKTPKYQLGKPVGTASEPHIRDPERHNKICKHVVAVLAATRDWDLPAPKKSK